MSRSIENFLLDKSIWKSKAPLKVESFVWTTVFPNRINTNDMLQKHKPLIALSPNTCVICCYSSELVSHLFFSIVLLGIIFGASFEIFWENWVSLTSYDLFLFFIKLNSEALGFINKLRFYRNVHFFFAILWCLWLERNTKIFKGISSFDNIWDRV